MITPITITFGDGTAPVETPSGGLASGAITFTLMLGGVPVTITDESTGATIVPQPIVAAIYQGQLLANPSGGGPYTPLTLAANDDGTTVPVGTYYNIHEQLTAGSLPDWKFVVHAAASGGTQSLISQRPTP